MQTFLPVANFAESARCLDRLRLGKQRVEVLQLLKGQFTSHPASRMWMSNHTALVVYGLAICEEWTCRGYRDTVSDKLFSLALDLPGVTRIHDELEFVFDYPPWFGNEGFHASHRSALLAKDPDWYSQFNWTDKPQINYVWPVPPVSDVRFVTHQAGE